MRTVSEAWDISGWNWVMYTFRRSRRSWTGHVAEPASTAAPGGGNRNASVWPTNASNDGGRARATSSASPAPVRVTVTGPVSSRYVESTTPPATIPIEPTP